MDLSRRLAACETYKRRRDSAIAMLMGIVILELTIVWTLLDTGRIKSGVGTSTIALVATTLVLGFSLARQSKQRMRFDQELIAHEVRHRLEPVMMELFKLHRPELSDDINAFVRWRDTFITEVEKGYNPRTRIHLWLNAYMARELPPLPHDYTHEISPEDFVLIEAMTLTVFAN